MKQTKEFNITIYDIELPFELYSIDYIFEELKKNKELFGMVRIMENATKQKIKNFYKEHLDDIGENARYFSYIKFFEYDGEYYGIVGGKTNYTNPDLSFDEKKDIKDKRYARNFLDNEGLKWNETILIINHKPSASEEADEQAALFVECYIQRIFNLFES